LLTNNSNEELKLKCWQKLPPNIEGEKFHYLGDYGIDLHWSGFPEKNQGGNLNNLSSLLRSCGKKIPVKKYFDIRSGQIRSSLV
jgi:hypothetical protein